MDTALARPTNGYYVRPTPSGLADVINTILDKGMVIDAFVRVSLVGIELLTIDVRIVIASVDTYLRFAEAVNRLQLGSNEEKPGLPQLMERMGKSQAKKKLAEPARAVKHGAEEVAEKAKPKRHLFGGHR